jgi:SNF2 family DNA or RNA helicase
MAWRHIERLEKIRFDLMVCDEAHQLKGNDSKLRKKLSSLDINRKLLLSGTPLQNDVEEFYSILDFARPTVFGSLAEFKAQIQEKEGMEVKYSYYMCIIITKWTKKPDFCRKFF